jgi:Fe2+ or Zn2+ uptake regulation protein
MSERGLVKKLEITGVKKRFDGDTDPHYHVRCTECGSIGDVKMLVDRNFVEGIRSTSDFDIQGYNLEFIGKCPECRGTADESVH